VNESANRLGERVIKVRFPRIARRDSHDQKWKPTGRKGPKSHTFPGKCNRIKCDNRVICKLTLSFTLFLGLLSPPMPSFRKVKTF
jgi:hypothetical protein